MSEIQDTVQSETHSSDKQVHIKTIYDYRDKMQEKLRQDHPFYKWVRENVVSHKKKLDIMPVMTVFVMNFRDMNKWVIRFPDANDIFKQTINGSTTEDETHSKLFLEDWRKLHMDDKLAWKPSDVMWWLFLSPDMEPFRKFGVEFMKLSVEDEDDVFVRFAHSEAGEACGHVFFEHISPIADTVAEDHGVDYRYFGTFHLDLETGHVLESEDIFEDQMLTQAQYDQGMVLAERMFGIFDGIHDAFYNYAKQYVETDTTPKTTLAWQASETTPNQGVGSAEYCVTGEESASVHSSQEKLENHLLARKEKVANHPFYNWLQTTNLPAMKRLQRFIPLWSVDIFGYRDLNKYVFKYDAPKNPLEETVNTAARDLEGHSQLFLNDWINLKLDEVLRWPASDTLGFVFLDYFMDQHRETLINFGMKGLKHNDAFERLWFMEALEASGHAFFENVKKVALEAEKDENITLDYLADRHYLVHPEENAEGTRVNFKAIDMENEDKLQTAMSLIDTVFDALERNLDLSLQAAEENKLSVR